MNQTYRSKFTSNTNQGGWTFWSVLFVMSVITFFSYVGMQLVPVYSTNQNVVNAMRQSMKDVDLATTSRATIIRKLNAQLYLDGSHELLNYKTDLVVRRTRKQFIVETHYRQELPLFFNLSLMVTFDNVEERDITGSSPSS